MFTLYPYQQEHLYNIGQQFETNNVVYDISDVGAGKTYTTLAYVKKLNNYLRQIHNRVPDDISHLIREFYHVPKVYILCPLSLVSKWEDLWQIVLPNSFLDYSVMTYRKFLLKKDTIVIEPGSFFIADEGHILRNPNQTSFKLEKLLRCGDIRMLVLSSTLLDKNEQEARFRTSFQMTNDNLIKMDFEPDTRISTVMHKVIIDDEKDKVQITKGFGTLLSMFSKNGDDEKSVDNERKIAMAKLSKGLHLIHKGMTNSAITLTRDLFNRKHRIKIIVITPYIDCMNAIFKNLKGDYNCAVMNGKTKSAERDRLISLFNEPTSDLSVLITSFQVGSVGIDLDDKVGNIERHSIILPVYNTIDIYQMIGRTRRASTKSTVNVHFINAREGGYMFILDRIQEKMKTLSGYSNSTIPDSIVNAVHMDEQGPLQYVPKKVRKPRKKKVKSQ